MEKFFVKHIKEFKEGDAIKLISKKVKKAKKLCEIGDPSYLKKLAEAHCMIHDFIESKGLTIDMVLKT